MSLFSFEMTGLDEAQAALRKQREALSQEKRIREVMVEAAGPILERIRAALPKLTGLTAEDLRINPDVPQGANGTVRIEIGAGSGKSGRAYILRFIEFGTSKVPARGIIRTTWDAEQDAYIERVVAGIREILNG